jgi:hypothetical protein
MKKIMFSERYGLESAVLAGRKTMTRRAVVHPKRFRGHDDVVLEFHRRPGADFCFDSVVLDADDHELGQLPLPYEVGDVVAIAHRYKDLWAEYLEDMDNPIYKEFVENFASNLFSAGHDNKMFVRADLMPHQICITDLWFERLQAISDDDCLKEGVHVCKDGGYWLEGPSRQFGGVIFNTPREAFAALIDKVSGPNTWHTNPWVIAYTFELIK